MGKIIILDDYKKDSRIEERNNAINKLVSLIDSLVSSFDLLLDDYIDGSLEDDYNLFLDEVNETVSKLNDFKNYLLNLDIQLSSENLFKLEVMVKQSNIFSRYFKEEFLKDDSFDHVMIQRTIYLAFFFVDYMNELYNKEFDYDRTMIEIINIERKELKPKITQLIADARIDVYTKKLINSSKGLFRKIKDLQNQKEKEEIVNDAIKYVISNYIDLDSIAIEICFEDMIKIYRDKGVFLDYSNLSKNNETIREQLVLWKEYYDAILVISNFSDFVFHFCISGEVSDTILECFGNLMNSMEELYNSEEDYGDKIVYVKTIMALMLEKIKNMASEDPIDDEDDDEYFDEDDDENEECDDESMVEDECEESDSDVIYIEDVFEDDIINNSIIWVSNYLINYLNSSEEIELFSLKYLWKCARSHSIFAFFNQIVSLDISSNREFYSSGKYRALLDNIIREFSLDEQYIKSDVSPLEEFSDYLNFLKNAYVLEKATLANQIDELSYLFNDLSYSKYVENRDNMELLDSILSPLQYVNIAKFLEGATYAPLEIECNGTKYVSLYKNSAVTLVWDYEKYLLLSNNNVTYGGFCLLNSDYSDKEIMRKEIIRFVVDKYNSNKIDGKVRKKVNDGEGN